MKSYSTKKLIILNIILLIPLIMYGIYKNGILIYSKNLINLISIFKPLYLILIGLLIKVIVDLIKYKKIQYDYNFIYVILIGMMMPYNINYLVYIILFLFIYIFCMFLNRYIKFNKVCFIYLGIILVNFLINDFTFLSPLEQNYSFSYEFIDLLVGRNVGGLCTTSIFFTLISYIILINNYYYKKDIPLSINLTYLALIGIYSIISSNTNYLLNSELIFASIFVSTLPEYSPYKVNNQIIYGIVIGVISFILTITFNSVISIYIATFVMSLTENINIKHNTTKRTIDK